ncbi:hypothetical protein [Rossellomorea marisflavi]|uniref:hypothetical protein n=1 Tax=Rossellomorea marisflavi TaxID=189381 RepID=UPI00345A0277
MADDACLKTRDYLVAISRSPEALLSDEAASLSDVTLVTINIKESPMTLIAARESATNGLRAGDTDRYHLLTREWQGLTDLGETYFVYDYRVRKPVNDPNELCYPLVTLEMQPQNIQQAVQHMKDIKQEVFAGFRIKPMEDGKSISFEVLVSSPLLNRLSDGGAEPGHIHHHYLQTVYDTLSSPAICERVLVKHF